MSLETHSLHWRQKTFFFNFSGGYFKTFKLGLSWPQSQKTSFPRNLFSPEDLLQAMKALGLSPTEQEVVDMQCEVEKKGRIFFPDFCRLCLRKFREFNEEHFRQELFKNICGTEPHPVRFRAKKYKISEKSFSRVEFEYMMSRLPVYVSEDDIAEMFSVADRDQDGRISYNEFLTMITPRQPTTAGTAANIKLNLTISGGGVMLPTSEPQLIHTGPTLSEPIREEKIADEGEQEDQLVDTGKESRVTDPLISTAY
ncbi:uncharacterized protein LOC111700214 [Eurytemora carolleeae]|uniref:uncharacterized protein LOC111700214 n=1 Tax=Eurytemora carolleeae TaxID=1294199 RepID=UPI000C76F346|nr:uncharacterized protein LOC111700214 [Eurytemora carolleeae]|eukprot:XP_023326846.1 uncharacterized protein LOC111700214 [Eurytemora affinis]